MRGWVGTWRWEALECRLWCGCGQLAMAAAAAAAPAVLLPPAPPPLLLNAPRALMPTPHTHAGTVVLRAAGAVGVRTYEGLAEAVGGPGWKVGAACVHVRVQGVAGWQASGVGCVCARVWQAREWLAVWHALCAVRRRGWQAGRQAGRQTGRLCTHTRDTPPPPCLIQLLSEVAIVLLPHTWQQPLPSHTHTSHHHSQTHTHTTATLHPCSC